MIYLWLVQFRALNSEFEKAVNLGEEVRLALLVEREKQKTADLRKILADAILQRLHNLVERELQAMPKHGDSKEKCQFAS